MNLDEMDLSVRTYNCLKRAGINTIVELSNKTTDDIYKIRNLGRSSLSEILNVMKVNGFTFRDVEMFPENIHINSITAEISENAAKFQYKMEDKVLSTWGYNKSDIENALKELAEFKSIGLEPIQINQVLKYVKAAIRDSQPFEGDKVFIHISELAHILHLRLGG